MAHNSWLRAVAQLLLLLSLAMALGSLFDAALLFGLLAALLIVGRWLYQLRRISQWIEHPDHEPPEASGIWGYIFDQIYHLQRRDREERDRLQTAVSYMRDSFASLKNGTVLVDPQGNIEWSNAAAEDLLGLQYPRDRGQAILNLLRQPIFNSYFSTGHFSSRLRMECPTDSRRQLLVEITTFGRGSRLLFARDVTREQQLEEMRRDFVANVSHELRTPLTVITGYLLTMIDSGLGEQRETLAQPLAQMRQQAERMETLLKDLLWLSRLESADGQNVQHSIVDIAKLLAEVRTEALGAYPERDVALQLESSEKLPGDYQQLHSAFSNLVFNALKYSEGRVTVRWFSTSQDLRLEVTDRGAGIDAVHLPRLTERFYRVEKSRSLETGGTGLGLAIVKHVLAGHDAQLEIDSVPGQGSTFRSVFPLS